MRVCRFEQQGRVEVGFFHDSFVVPIDAARSAYQAATAQSLEIPDSNSLLSLLPHGSAHESSRKLAASSPDSSKNSPTLVTGS